MSERRVNLISAVRGMLAILAVAAAYEYAARFGGFSPALLPPLPRIGATLVDMLADGRMIGHIAATLGRVLAGFAIAIAVAVPLGILMGRFSRWSGSSCRLRAR